MRTHSPSERPPKYVLITAARNEEAFLDATLRSVVRQTILPERWVIVDDGSTDRTGEIIEDYRKRHPFIVLMSRTSGQSRNFGSKARAVNWAYQHLANIDFDFVGNLDADITLPEDYYEQLMRKFAQNKALGLAGGIRYDMVNGKPELVHTAENSVGGPIQFFRRRCWEDVGGYIPLPYGGLDAVAETAARRAGWQVQTFPDLKVYHHRKTGSQDKSWWQSAWTAGKRAQSIGYDPLFLLARCLRRINERPVLVYSVVWYLGYVWSKICGQKPQIPAALIHFLRSEQRNRLVGRNRVKIL